MKDRWQAIVPVLEEFQSWLSAKVPKLEIVEANDKSSSLPEYEQRKATGVFDNYGVYLIFDGNEKLQNEKLQYVGVAMNRYHDRIWDHDDQVDRRYTDLIPLKHEYYFLAPALEFFLIVRLHPPKNKVYSDYTIPEKTIETRPDPYR